MNILFYDMGSYTYQDTLHYLKQLGHTCKTVYYHFPDKFHDDFFCDRFEKQLQSDSYDAVISVNFFPLVADLCHAHQIPYLAWCYDSPLEEKLEDYFSYDTNRIFLFDRIETEHYQRLGYSHVQHLPLAVNTKRLDKLQFSPAQMQKHRCDVSFIGHLYESPLQVLLYSADDYIKGYIEGILQAQLRVYGYYFIGELITDELLDSVNQSFRKVGQTSLTLNHRGLSFAIASEITNLERCFLLEQMGELFNTHFYTTKPHSLSDHVISLGPVKYMEEMPCVFRSSRLNLNPTLKSIQSGIPLRALDIMGSKGVLLSNFQPELVEYFEDGQDLILYSSIEEAVEKATYYLEHDDIRKQIAQNGYEKIKEYFTYTDRIQKMLATI